MDTTSSYEFDLKASRRVKGDAFGRMSFGESCPILQEELEQKLKASQKEVLRPMTRALLSLVHTLAFAVSGWNSEMKTKSRQLKLKPENINNMAVRPSKYMLLHVCYFSVSTVSEEDVKKWAYQIRKGSLGFATSTLCAPAVACHFTALRLDRMSFSDRRMMS